MSHWDKLSNDLMYDILERKSKLQYDEVVKELNSCLLVTIRDYLLLKSNRFTNFQHNKCVEFYNNWDDIRYKKMYKNICKYTINFITDCCAFMKDELNIESPLLMLRPMFDRRDIKKNHFPFNKDERNIFYF